MIFAFFHWPVASWRHVLIVYPANILASIWIDYPFWEFILYCIVRRSNCSFPPVDFNYTFRGKLKVTIIWALYNFDAWFLHFVEQKRWRRPFLTTGITVSSIPKILEDSLTVILFAWFRVRSKFSRVLLHFCFASVRVIFLEYLANERKSLSCFGVRKGFSGWTWKLRLWNKLTVLITATLYSSCLSLNRTEL